MSERTVPIARRGQRGLVFLVILLGLVMLFSSMPAARAANPEAGTISTSVPSTSWQGHLYAAGATSLPDECPPAIDPVDALCDHFDLNIDLDPNFWLTHVGSVVITIQWASSDNDFDLYVYRQSDGAAGGLVRFGRDDLGAGGAAEPHSRSL